MFLQPKMHLQCVQDTTTIIDLLLSSFLFQFFLLTMQGVNLWTCDMASFGFVMFLPIFTVATGFIAEKFLTLFLIYNVV